MKTEAEMGEMLTQAKESPKVGAGKGGFSSLASEEAWP